ncbi:MAG: hypothetical protein FJW23_04735 [Acidimicrobiia bacterium]|nr:hypothetical protein [Acidimicrobiia bacterium]
MSRVVYEDRQATPEQERLRAAYGLRLVSAEEEGTGVDALPPGVYGFTYSAALPNAPLFAVPRFRCYENQKRPNGQVVLVGFVSDAHARALSAGGDTVVEILLQPAPEAGAETLVEIPQERIRHHRQFAVRTEHGLTLRVAAR